MTLQNHWLRAASWALAAVLFAAIFAGVFQVAVRYRYEKLDGVTWRVDQLTNQRCRVVGKAVDCGPPASASTSTSTSLSTSISLSSRIVARRSSARPH
ncbi:MAG TPA: hypothetical protein VEW74_10575 [Candidatus Nitrosotalea sp.]|nr:hypothetical protein [Candidatus Nitrosotalea sp.]